MCSCGRWLPEFRKNLQKIKAANFTEMLVTIHKTNFNGKIVPVHFMKAYGGLDLRLHSFLTFSLDEREWSASRLDCFTLEKAAPNNR